MWREEDVNNTISHQTRFHFSILTACNTLDYLNVVNAHDAPTVVHILLQVFFLMRKKESAYL